MRGWYRRRPQHRATPPQTTTQETFGLPACDTHLIAKLRVMDPALLATILAKEAAS